MSIETEPQTVGDVSAVWTATCESEYSRVSFCDGSLLRHLSSRTEYNRLVMHHCRNSRVLSLLSALLTLFRCARVSSFSVLVQFF